MSARKAELVRQCLTNRSSVIVKEGKMEFIVKQELIERKIYLMRGQNVMLDRDLAELYGVQTKVFIQAVKRNKRRFPNDFMFQLAKKEFENLRSQFVTSSWGGRRYLPYAFTEQGVAMLSSILNSERAILVNIGIMRIFVNIRRLVSANKGILNRLNHLKIRCRYRIEKSERFSKLSAAQKR